MNPDVKKIEDLTGITLSRAEILKLPPKKLAAYLENASSKEINDLADGNVRYKRDPKSYEYLDHWLKFGRAFGYATQDGSWSEFEKEFSIIIRRLVQAERVLKKLGVQDAWDYENGITDGC